MIFENIKELARENENFRHVIYSGKHSQIVLMSLLVGEDIGMETHGTSDQILFIVHGDGKAIVGREKTNIKKHSVIFVPAGTEHNIINKGNDEMKLYTIYAPSVHADGIIHKTKAEAGADLPDHI